MPLHPQAQLVLDVMNATPLGKIQDYTPEEIRALTRSMLVPSAEAVARVEDRLVPGLGGDIAVRIYRPTEDPVLPVLVYFHGGGWMFGDLDVHDDICRSFANAAGCIVVSVDYRLAPEHRFPAAVDDAFAATSWVHAHAAELGVDRARVAVGGDSAGGNLAAVVSLLARDTGSPPLVFQLLICPVTDHEFESASMGDNAEGYFLERASMQHFYDLYLHSEDDGDDWRVSPIRAPDLTRLPPTLMMTAEFDPLRDQGEEYARRLADAGVRVVSRRYDGVFHDFIVMHAAMDTGQQAFDDAVAALRVAFGA
jgi:acetyl esterase